MEIGKKERKSSFQSGKLRARKGDRVRRKKQGCKKDKKDEIQDEYMAAIPSSNYTSGR